MTRPAQLPAALRGTFVNTGPCRRLFACRAEEAPVAEAASGLDVFDDELESVAKVEGDVSFLEGLEEAGVASGVRACQAVPQERTAETPALLCRVDSQEAEIPMRFRYGLMVRLSDHLIDRTQPFEGRAADLLG